MADKKNHYNICRPFILYNDFLPPDENPHEEWQYLAFGYVDGISVGENLFEKGACSLERLWRHDLRQAKELEGTYSAQTIYGFRCEESGENQDGSFWEEALKDKTRYPFVFISLLQGKMKKAEADISRRRELEQRLADQGKRKAITYLTLDNSGILLVLLCRTYEDGVELLDRLHYTGDRFPLKEIGIRLTYSFSVAAVQKYFLNSDAIHSLQGKAIEHVYIYGIEQYPGSFAFVQEKIKDKLGRAGRIESVLGCNDEVLVVDAFPWPAFLECFRDREGVLNNSHPQYGENLIGVTTIISGNSCEEGEPGTRTGNSDYYRRFGGRLKEITEKIAGNTDPRYQGLKRYLYQVINALQKFGEAPLTDYMFCSLLFPIDMVLQILKQVEKENTYDFFGSFYEFVKGLNLCIQDSSRSDRQFVQTLDFDARIYSVSMRLRAFYNAFIYSLKNFLAMTGETSQGKHEYEFLSCFGIADKVQVRELFRNIREESRLFLVDIPENQTYDIQLMSIVLGHEVAHFAGQTVRSRDYRYICAISITAKIATEIFHKKLSEWAKGQADRILEKDFLEKEDYWQTFQRKLENFLEKKMDFQKRQMSDMNYLNENYPAWTEKEKQKISRLNQLYSTYTYQLRENLADNLDAVMREYREELYGYLLGMEYLYWLERDGDVSAAEERRRRLSDEISDIIRYITGYSVWDKKSMSAIPAIELMMSLFKECEADLMAILTLRLPFKDYLYTVWKSVSDQGIQNFRMPKEVGIRTGVVVSCMRHPPEAGQEGWYWTDEIMKEAQKTDNRQIKKMINEIYGFVNQFFTTSPEMGLYEKDNTVIDVFLDAEVLMILQAYLLECRKRFFAAFIREDAGDIQGVERLQDMQKKLQAAYRLYQEENVEDLIWEIKGFIEDYKESLQEKIREKLKEEGDIE